jgi:hypothetical protein
MIDCARLFVSAIRLVSRTVLDQARQKVGGLQAWK